MIRNFAYASLSAASALLLMVLLLIAARTLGEVEFGKFAFALALGTIFETLMDFGLHPVTIRAVARDPAQAPALLHHTLAIKLLWAGGTFLLLAASATFLRPEHDVRLACYLIGGSLVLRSYMLTIRGVLLGLERFGWDSFLVIADRGILLLFGATALLLGGGLRGLTIAFVAARATGLALAALFTHTRLGGLAMRFDRDVWLNLHREALPLGFFLVVLNLYSYIDGVMLGMMRTDSETGLYTAAYRVYEGMSYVPSALSAVLIPRLSELFTSDRRKHRMIALLSLGGALALGVAASVVAWIAARPALTLLYGPSFAPAADPFRLLVLGLSFVFVIWVLHATAISINREQLLLKTAIVGLTVNVAVNLYAIPRFGASGAAIATVVGEVVSMTILLVATRRLWRGR